MEWGKDEKSKNETSQRETMRSREFAKFPTLE